jgi:hypothetical protein
VATFGAAHADSIDDADPKQTMLDASLQIFCKKWMGFLAQREVDNKAAITWRTSGQGVEGEFVGYQKEYVCALSPTRETTKAAVGTIKYLEFKFHHKGSSTTEALANRPKILEATEVTEIFRYSKNQWIY